MHRDNFTMSESSDSFGMQQRQDRFDAIGDLIVGPPGPPGPQGPPGADGTVSFDELTPAQRESLRGEGVPAGGTTGQVLAKSSNADYATRWVDAGGSASLTILSYGHSTWADFIAAYNSRSIVYCRASSGSDPASGSQTRLAFMTYVNSAASPTSVEFQYYRSVSSHTDAQQGDQVFIYKLTSGGTWTVTVREAYTKIVAGSNMTSSYADGTLTLNATGGGTADALPLAGGTMEGDIDMGSNKITNLPTPTNYLDAANKNYVDARYIKPSTGIPQTDLASAVQTSLGLADSALQSVPSTYRTAAAQDAIDTAQDAEIGIVITGKRPSMAVTAGQYVIVRNSTISGISDGLYTANAALSPSTDVTAANLTSVSEGGLNSLIEVYETQPTVGDNVTNVGTFVKRSGKVAVFSGIARATANLAGKGATIFTIPSEYAPNTGVTASCYATYNSNPGMYNFFLQPDGVFRTNVGAGIINADTAVYINFTYFTK